MEQTSIIDQLKTIIEPYVQDKAAFATITGETDLLNELKVNSANLVDIIIDIEMAFDIEISDDDAEQMLKVKDAISVIEKLVEA